MFKLKFYPFLLLILTTFLMVPILHSASDNLSGGGNILFDDEIPLNSKEKEVDSDNKLQKNKDGRVIKKVEPYTVNNEQELLDTEKEISQIEAARKEIKLNLKNLKREAYLDENSSFKLDKEETFYGINVLVLKINTKRDKSGRVLGLLPEHETQETAYIDKKNNPEYYLELDRNNYKERPYMTAELYESHKTLLRSFVKKIPKDQDAIIIMYLNGSNIKDYSDGQMKLEKMVYAQFVTNFLYRNKKKLVIERRYMENIPENEIFMVISRYEGSITPNIYNSSKGNILQWLARYKELEREQIMSMNKSRLDLENSLKTTSDDKNKNFLLAPVNREISTDSYDIKIDEDNLYKSKKRKVKPRDKATPEDEAPRRVAEYEEEEVIVDDDNGVENIKEDTETVIQLEDASPDVSPNTMVSD